MQVVVVHRGARDAYQVAAGLQDAGLIDTLVTDLYWPSDRAAAALIERALPPRAKQLLRARNSPLLRSANVELKPLSGLYSVAMSRAPFVPFSAQARALRWSDDCLGRRAAAVASKNRSALLSYSYYGYSAFSNLTADVPRILFQLHPHPLSVRTLLTEELEKFPECAATLSKEWELALTEVEFRRLTDEVKMAQHWIAASSFTKRTLTENGVPASDVHVVPYGVDLEKFRNPPRKSGTGPLKLLLVGRMTQRKGIQYLIDALDMLDTDDIELTVCGWGLDASILARTRSTRIRLMPSASAAEVQEAYRDADLFVLPSVAEGFAHVLLEAMASGLPILSTTNTAAPDLIEGAEQGFVIPPCNASAIAERLEWALTHRRALVEMSAAARRRAEHFTWARFRTEIAALVANLISPEQHRLAAISSHAL